MNLINKKIRYNLGKLKKVAKESYTSPTDDICYLSINKCSCYSSYCHNWTENWILHSEVGEKSSK
jgi:hypothetical protein